MKDPAPKQEGVISKILRINARRFTNRYLPVAAKDGLESRGSFGRWVVEELFFAPNKVHFLTWAFKRKSAVQPGLLTIMYVWLVSMVTLFPLFLVQALCWQAWRIVKSGYGLLTGTTVYLDKERVLGKDESKKD